MDDPTRSKLGYLQVSDMKTDIYVLISEIGSVSPTENPDIFWMSMSDVHGTPVCLSAFLMEPVY